MPTTASTRRPFLAAALTILLVCAGCGSSDDSDPPMVYCTMEGYTPIRAAAFDAVTGSALTLTSASISQTAGPGEHRYHDTRIADGQAGEVRRDGILLALQMKGNRVWVHNVVGTYDLTLRADGYRDHVEAAIEIPWTTDGCFKPTRHVEFEARLQPATGRRFSDRGQ